MEQLLDFLGKLYTDIICMMGVISRSEIPRDSTHRDSFNLTLTNVGKLHPPKYLLNLLRV